MPCVFHDTDLHLKFAPLSLTKPISELHMGILTNTDRWLKLLGTNQACQFATQAHLHAKFPAFSEEESSLHINAAVIPSKGLADEVLRLQENEELRSSGEWVARKGVFKNGMEVIEAQSLPTLVLKNIWHLFQFNDKVLTFDFELITKERTSAPIAESNTIIGNKNRIFLEPGAKVEASVLNTNSGPIYIGKNAEIMEGSLVRGGLALLADACLKMGTKIYGASTVGPHCKVGGEISNVIFQAYSNKGHDGFLGNSLIGEWCNLGADTNSSNLKNNYSSVRVYSYATKQFEQTNLQFLGLIMGDHSKSGINTMFNTASVVGVSANVFGAEFPPKYIPSFAWGGSTPMVFEFEKACEAAENMMKRRNIQFTQADKTILKYLFENTTHPL
jgi:UDP-N-acetylglucosamine diphosphorylase/glucosamine-1-phosphate N-acetyltransferase